MAENEDRWGKMKSYYEDGDMTNVSKIMGISENHPRFVDGPDSRMWEDIWRKEAEDAGFEYVHG